MSIARIQNTPSAVPVSPPVRTCDLIQKIALACLKELVVALAFGALVACFVPTPAGIVVLINAFFIQLAVSLCFQTLGAYFKKITPFCQWVTAANFAFFTGYNTQLLVHETGHALAFLALYNRPQPQIAVQPFATGVTQFYKASLSPLGKRLGPVATTCIAVACGPAFTLLVSAVLFTLGLAIKESYPQLGKHLIAWSLIDFFNHADYAYGALRMETTSLNHDFVHLAIFGLHPAVAAIGIIAIPIVISLGMHLYKKRAAAI